MNCKDCGECCRHIGIHIPLKHGIPYVLEFFAARGFTPKYKTKTTIFLWADITCPHLTKDGCDIYETRPQACKDYIGEKDPFIHCPLKEK